MAKSKTQEKAPFCRKCGTECERYEEPTDEFDSKTGRRMMADRWICPKEPCAHIHGCNYITVQKKFLWLIPYTTLACSRCGRGVASGWNVV